MLPTRTNRSCRPFVLLALVLLASPVGRAADEPLPNPLTLDHVLQLADAPHPDIDRVRAQLDAARAGLAQAESASGIRAYLDGTPQWVLPSTRATDEYVNDSRARFVVGKRLYDFGRSASLESAARAEIESREQQMLDARQARRLELMSRFFDVLLADLRYAVDNETLAYRYVRFDQSRDRVRLGQMSEVDHRELETLYQDSLIDRTRSLKRQAQSRQQLALALNRPGQLPADLVLPQFPGNEREPPELEAQFEQARQRNPLLQGLRKEVESARARVDAERARRYPVLSAEGEVARYEREFPGRDDVRATLNLRIPIWQGGEDRAAIEAALARFNESDARLRRAELDLRQTLLDLIQEIETLRIERNAAKVRSAWRELYLDRARALYEMEVRTDFGDAQTRITEAQWLAAQAEFRLALAWARLEAVTGQLTSPPLQETVK